MIEDRPDWDHALIKAEMRGKAAGYRAALEDMAFTAEATQKSLRDLWAALDRLNVDLEMIMKAREKKDPS